MRPTKLYTNKTNFKINDKFSLPKLNPAKLNIDKNQQNNDLIYDLELLNQEYNHVDQLFAQLRMLIAKITQKDLNFVGKLNFPHISIISTTSLFIYLFGNQTTEKKIQMNWESIRIQLPQFFQKKGFQLINNNPLQNQFEMITNAKLTELYHFLFKIYPELNEDINVSEISKKFYAPVKLVFINRKLIFDQNLKNSKLAVKQNKPIQPTVLNRIRTMIKNVKRVFTLRSDEIGYVLNFLKFNDIWVLRNTCKKWRTATDKFLTENQTIYCIPDPYLQVKELVNEYPGIYIRKINKLFQILNQEGFLEQISTRKKVSNLQLDIISHFLYFFGFIVNRTLGWGYIKQFLILNQFFRIQSEKIDFMNLQSSKLFTLKELFKDNQELTMKRSLTQSSFRIFHRILKWINRNFSIPDQEHQNYIDSRNYRLFKAFQNHFQQ